MSACKLTFKPCNKHCKSTPELTLYVNQGNLVIAAWVGRLKLRNETRWPGRYNCVIVEKII